MWLILKNKLEGLISILAAFVIVIKSAVHMEAASGAAGVWSWWNEVIKIRPIPCWWMTSSSASCFRTRASQWFRLNKLIRFSLRLILYAHLNANLLSAYHISLIQEGGVMSPESKWEVPCRLQLSNARVEWKRCCTHRAQRQLAEANCSQTNLALTAVWPSLSPIEFYRDAVLAAPLTAVNHLRLLNKCLFMWVILSSTLKITSTDGSTVLERPTDSRRLHHHSSVLADGEETSVAAETSSAISVQVALDFSAG